ncbi:hypothetical protein C7S18_23885 (plasmid) [Ahniella affigens]|uniref:HTH cro/C1-type domain-containing protein n=1 Tax=Ahniella affigens TaxID=2021234 RepID=A0A2P1PZS1_9GAMM|nr:hypothetical protein C7S18_23885 [Ahniella affigens]
MNLGTLLKQEIRRITRIELNRSIQPLRTAIGYQRRQIANTRDLIRSLRHQVTVSSKTPVDANKQRRFSPSRLAILRSKKGLTMAQMADLVETSVPTLLKWLAGTARPSDDQLHRLAWIRSQGKRELARHLAKNTRQ